MLGNTLLLVDDNEFWLKTTARYFKQFKYDVHTASNCDGAIRQAHDLKPDYILLDYHLGDEEAVTVCNYIRSCEELKKTNLLVISGDDYIRPRAYRECQADHFILKCPPAEILDVINSLKRRIYWEKGIEERGDLCVQREDYQVYLDYKPVLRLSEDRFTLFSLLVAQSPAFLDSETIARSLYGNNFPPEKQEYVKVLLHRLKSDLGPLENRIQNSRGEGWAYIPSSQ